MTCRYRITIGEWKILQKWCLSKDIQNLFPVMLCGCAYVFIWCIFGTGNVFCLYVYAVHIIVSVWCQVKELVLNNIKQWPFDWNNKKKVFFHGHSKSAWWNFVLFISNKLSVKALFIYWRCFNFKGTKFINKSLACTNKNMHIKN